MLRRVTRSLSVVVDGRPLAEEEARPLWERFSAHMQAHEGDFEGFALAAGFVSAQVGVLGNVPTLTLSSTAMSLVDEAKSQGSPKAKSQQRGRRGKRRRGKPKS